MIRIMGWTIVTVLYTILVWFYQEYYCDAGNSMVVYLPILKVYLLGSF